RTQAADRLVGILLPHPRPRPRRRGDRPSPRVEDDLFRLRHVRVSFEELPQLPGQKDGDLLLLAAVAVAADLFLDALLPASLIVFFFLVRTVFAQRRLEFRFEAPHAKVAELEE